MILEELSPKAREHVHLFRKSLPLQVKLQEIVRALGSTEGQKCLEIGSENAMLSYHLRGCGGDWCTVVPGEELAEVCRSVLGDDVAALEASTLPFESKVFDVVVVVDLLERVESDEAFIETCHRVIKADGRLVVNVARAKAWSLVQPLRRLLRITYEKKGMVRPGYSESELFTLLKDGFDVHQVRSYSRFFVEFVNTWVQFAEMRIRRSRHEKENRITRLYTFANVFYRLAYQLDMLMFLNKGYYLIASARRRTWRPRKAPVLSDGRSISEAVLSKLVR